MMPEPSMEEMQKVEFTKKVMLRKILSKSALERLSGVRLVKPDIAIQIETYLLSLYQSGKITSEVSDEQMKMILETISGTAEKKFNIVRK